MHDIEWVIENNEVFDSSQLLSVLKEQGKRISVFEDAWDLKKKIDNMPFNSPFRLPYCIYGSMSFVSALRSRINTSPYIVDEYSTLLCSSYYPYIWKALGRKFFFMPAGAISLMANHFGDKIFIRPNSSCKQFTGKVFEASKAAEEMALACLNRDEVLVCQEVVDLGQEYRCLFRNGKVFASSTYKNLDVSNDIVQFSYAQASKNIENYAIEIGNALSEIGINMCCIDVAENNGVIRLVEVNGINSIGLYGCNRGEYIKAMEREATKVFVYDS